MMSKKIATTIYITEKQQDQLKELNARLKVPISELIRQGINLIIKKYDENLSGQISLFEEKDQNEK
ncbi:MAG: ribbon-helix-helix domain-containing protein [Oligoflexia bacterium]|nr:ribbon-helix-helix domain-containing protein [Oligoflexia bacterium]